MIACGLVERLLQLKTAIHIFQSGGSEITTYPIQTFSTRSRLSKIKPDLKVLEFPNEGGLEKSLSLYR